MNDNTTGPTDYDDDPDCGLDDAECPYCTADAFRQKGTDNDFECAHCHHRFPYSARSTRTIATATTTAPSPAPADPDPERELLVDKALRQAWESLHTAARINTTACGEQSARVMGAQFDAAFAAVETLIELRAGNNSRTAAMFGVAGPTIRRIPVLESGEKPF